MIFSLNGVAEVCHDEALEILNSNIIKFLKVTEYKCKSYPAVSSEPKISLNLVPATPKLGARFDLSFTSKMDVKDIVGLKKTLAADFLNTAASMVETIDTDMKQKVEILTSTKTGYSTVSRNTRSPFSTKNFYSKCEIKKETDVEFETVCKFDDSIGDSKEFVTSYMMTRKCKKAEESFTCTTFVVMAPKPITRMGIQFASTNEVVLKGALRAVRSLVAQSVLSNSKDKTEAMEKYRCNDFERKINDYMDKLNSKFVSPPKFTYN